MMNIHLFSAAIVLALIAPPAVAESSNGPLPGKHGATEKNALHIAPASYGNSIADAFGASRKAAAEIDIGESMGSASLFVWTDLDASLNSVLVAGSGYGFQFDTRQEGRRNSVTGWSAGNGNAVTVLQAGVGNIVGFRQSGNGNTIAVSQASW